MSHDCDKYKDIAVDIPNDGTDDVALAVSYVLSGANYHNETQKVLAGTSFALTCAAIEAGWTKEQIADLVCGVIAKCYASAEGTK